jgi:uncharacterized OsmC-like protein
MSNAIKVTRQEGYQFLIDFAPGTAALLTDEAPPLGQGAGPTPVQILAAAVASCLGASLVFALSRAKQDPGAFNATASWEIARNATNRLRVKSMAVELTLSTSAGGDEIAAALGGFEDFCTVSQSVRAGFPIALTVRDSNGRVLKESADIASADA